MEVDVVERSLDLVHQIEGRRPGPEHREEVRQRGQSDRSPPDSNDSRRTILPEGRASISMPVLSRSSGCDSTSRPEPPGNNSENRSEKLRATSANAASKTSHDLLVDRLDHACELTTCVADVVELFLQEFVAFHESFVLGQCERVDRPHQPQLALELARPPRERDCPRRHRERAPRWRPPARNRNRDAPVRPPVRAAGGSRLPRLRASRHGRAALRAVSRPRIAGNGARRAGGRLRPRSLGLRTAAGAQPLCQRLDLADAGRQALRDLRDRRRDAPPWRPAAPGRGASSAGRTARRASTSARRAFRTVRRSSTAAPRSSKSWRRRGADSLLGRGRRSSSVRRSRRRRAASARLASRRVRAGSSASGPSDVISCSSSSARVGERRLARVERRDPDLDLAAQLRRERRGVFELDAPAPLLLRRDLARRGEPPRAVGGRSRPRPPPLPRGSIGRVRAAAVASVSAAGVTTDEPGGPARHAEEPPKRSPSCVTATTPGIRESRRRARARPSRRRPARTERTAGPAPDRAPGAPADRRRREHAFPAARRDAAPEATALGDEQQGLTIGRASDVRPRRGPHRHRRRRSP